MRVLLLFLLFFSIGVFASEPTLVYLVRHSEKEAQSQDPSLSAKGRNRVEMLRYYFEKIPLDAVFSSQYKRTQETAGPIAIDHGKELQTIKAQDPGAQIEALQSFSGGTVLVAGHSNTVPSLIKGLGGPDLSIEESQYDDLFLLILSDGKAILQHIQLKAWSSP